MEPNKLETTFFNKILRAELDVPVHATLKFAGTTFEVVVVPEIAPDGYFRFKYFNASPDKPEPQVGDDGTSYRKFTIKEEFGSHPLLERAWQEGATVELQLNPSRMPLQPNPPPTLEARVLYADAGNRGVLVLNNNGVALGESSLRKAEFSIADFCDFVTPATSFALISSISETDQQTLQGIADKLPDGAKLTLYPPRRVVLNTGDGWKITLTKDENATRGTISHTGVVEKNNGGDFEVGELRDTLEGLRYFFAFTMVKYCFPSVIVGYSANGRIIWGEAGRFHPEWQRPVNWFEHASDVPSGGILECLFPKFWRKWATNKDELTAVIDCYVTSETMQRSGVLRDSVAKSCAGLEIMAGLVRKQTIYHDAHDAIDKVLRCYSIPYRHLDSSKNPVTHKLCLDLNIADSRGASLLVDIRNYIVHPLDSNTVIKPDYLQYADGDMVQYVHLHDLSQFYLEYMLLRFCGHNVMRYRKLREDTTSDHSD